MQKVSVAKGCTVHYDMEACLGGKRLEFVNKVSCTGQSSCCHCTIQAHFVWY